MPIKMNRIVHTIGKSMLGGASGGLIYDLYTSILPIVKIPESAPTPKLINKLITSGLIFITLI